jgi:PAS domain S-box-containing protein
VSDMKPQKHKISCLIKAVLSGLAAWNWKRALRIKHRKETDAILVSSEEKFKVVFESANVGKAITLPTGEVNVNQALCDLLGYSREELQGKKWQDITPSDEIEATQKFLDSLLNGTKDSIRFNKRYIHKNGSFIYADVSTVINRDNMRKPLFFITTVIDITERKLAEDELRESERKLKEAQKMVHLGYWIWDVKTGDVEWSEEVYKIFCLDPKQFIPHINSILALSPWPEDHQRDEELIKRAIETRDTGFYEQKFLRPDNSIGYYSSTFQGNFDEKGDLISIVGAVMDITDRKTDEEKMRLSHDRFQRIIDSNIVGIIIATADGKLIEANDYYLNLIGFTREECESGKIDWRAITPPEWLPADENAIRELREKGTCMPYEKEYQRRDGKLISVLLADTILPGPEEQIAAFALDITERKRIEELLRENAAKLELTIDDAPVCVAMVGIDKRFLQCNKSFCTFIGYSNEEMKGKTIAEITFPDDVEIGMADMQAVLAGQRRNSKVQKRYVRKDGKVVWGEVNINIIWNKQGSPMYFLPVIQDITDRKYAEKTILKLNEDLEQIVDERTARLTETVAQLEELNRVFVDRELRMVELKERIAELEKMIDTGLVIR